MAPMTDDQDRWREINDALRRSQSLAAAGQHAASVMHDINNPLEAAVNLAYLIGEDAADPEKVRSYTEQLQEQLSSVTEIAKQTLSFFKAPETMKSTNLVEVAQAALRVHEYKISARKVQLRKKLPEQAMVMGHSGELLQVFSNLLSNAMDALPAQGSIAIRIRKSRQEVHFMIVDNGAGIAERHLNKIFEPFFTTKRELGTGMGLAISKAIVERHHGRMKARSSVRKGRSGTAFRISLPLSEAVAVLSPQA